MYLSSSESSEDELPPSVPLSRIVSDAASSMHAELRNLLTALAPMNNEERKNVLIDYAQRSRHLVLRTLTLIRWFSKYGTVTLLADKANAIAIARETCFEFATDSMWAVAHRSRKLARVAPAVSQAVDVLSTGTISDLPSSIVRLIDIDPSPTQVDTDVNMAMKRLKSATRSVLKSCMPMDDLKVLRWDSGSGGYCVSVGVANLWKTDLLLDRYDLENAHFLVKSMEVLLGQEEESDELCGTRKSAYLQDEDHLYMLRRMCEDRMRIAVQTIDFEQRKDARKRPAIMVDALRTVMMNEICLPLSMELLTREATRLMKNATYELDVTKNESSEMTEATALTLSYWQGSYDSAKIRFSNVVVRHPKVVKNGRNGESSSCLIRVQHDPPLPTLLPVNLEKLDLQQLSLERTLHLAMFARLYARLCQLRDVLISEVPKISRDNISISVTERELSASLVVIMQSPGSGLEFRVCQRSGALRVRPFGVALLAVPKDRFEDTGLWRNHKHFSNFPDEVSATVNAVSSVYRKVQLEAAATAMCMLDVGATRSLPPGTAWVAAYTSTDPASQLVPPFAPLERRTPRRFLTLSDPPIRDEGRGLTGPLDVNSKRQRLTYASTSDGLVFIQEGTFVAGERALNRYNGSAAAAAAWAVAREAVERRLRRDSLLRAFSAANVASLACSSAPYGQAEESDLDVDTASRTLLRVKCEPLPVQKAELLLRGNYAWQIRLSLLPAIFDSTDNVNGEDDPSPCSTSWSVGVSCVDSILTFTYPDADASAVRSFFRDLTRARTAAALARGVPPSSLYTVIRRSPVRLIVSINPFGNNSTTTSSPSPPFTVMVEYVYSKGNSGGFSVTFTPPKQTFTHLAPMVEETLDASGGSVGAVLAGLLERACPIAAAAEASVRERGRGQIKFVTALRVRAIFPAFQKQYGSTSQSIISDQNAQGADVDGRNGVRHAVDVDARNGGGIAKVIDVGRATAIMTAQNFAQRGGPNRRNKFAPVPMWDELVDQLSRNNVAVSICANSTVFLKMEHLEGFLADLVQSARREPARDPAVLAT